MSIGQLVQKQRMCNLEPIYMKLANNKNSNDQQQNVSFEVNTRFKD